MITESKFLSTLKIESREDSENIWVLTAPLIYQSKVLDKIIEVPVLFQTDLASVPRIPFIFEAWGNRAHYEAVLHDFGYRIDSGLAFMEANDLFLEAMMVRGKTTGIRYPMYWGVVIAGYSSFQKKYIGDRL